MESKPVSGESCSLSSTSSSIQRRVHGLQNICKNSAFPLQVGTCTSRRRAPVDPATGLSCSRPRWLVGRNAWHSFTTCTGPISLRWVYMRPMTIHHLVQRCGVWLERKGMHGGITRWRLAALRPSKSRSRVLVALATREILPSTISLLRTDLALHQQQVCEASICEYFENIWRE